MSEKADVGDTPDSKKQKVYKSEDSAGAFGLLERKWLKVGSSSSKGNLLAIEDVEKKRITIKVLQFNTLADGE